MDNNVIGLRIRELRLKSGQTQEDLGKLLHVKKQTISKYENGINIPDSEVLKKLSEIFNCSTDYLLGKDNIITNEEIKIETKYPYDLTPAQVEKLVSLLKDYRFDIDSLIKEIKEGNIENEL